MFEIEIKGLEKLDKLPDQVDDLLFEGMKDAMELAERTTKDTYLSGKALNRRTGLLYRSIGVKVTRSNIEGSLGDHKGTTPYGAFWEYGGLRRGVYIAARPFLNPAVYYSLVAMTELMAKKIEKDKGKR